MKLRFILRMVFRSSTIDVNEKRIFSEESHRMEVRNMSFALKQFTTPDFSAPQLAGAPDAVICPAPKDAVAPEGYHAMSIYPEYFKIGGEWLLAQGLGF